MRKGNARNGLARAGRKSELLQQYGGVEDCETYEILWQSSLSVTKSPQYKRVINGLGLLSFGDFSRLRVTMPACLKFNGPHV